MKLKNLTATLTGKFILLLFVVSFIPSAAGLTYIFFQSINILKNNYNHIHYQDFSNYKNSFTKNPEMMILGKLLSTDDELKIKMFLNLENQILNRAEFFYKDNKFDILRIIDNNGNIVVNYNKHNIDFNHFPDYLKKSTYGEEVIIIEEINEKYYFTISLPVRDVTSNLILGGIAISYIITDDFISNFEINSNNIYILKIDNTLFSNLKNRIKDNDYDNNFGLKNYTFFSYDISDMILAQNSKAVLYYGTDNRVLLSMIKNLQYKYLIIFVLIVSFLIITAYLLGKKVVKPLMDLINITKEIGKGNLNVELKTDQEDEIGLLYNNFDIMLKSLVHYQEGLVKTAKLASIGQIAAGVSHEINNPLVTILGYSQLLKEQLEKAEFDKDKFLKYLNIIESDAKRSKRIIANLLTLANPQPLNKTYININSLIMEFLPLIKHQIMSKKIKLILLFEKDIKAFKADSGQLKQVFINILINSVDAIENTNGIISIKTYHKNKSVIMEISDNGTGIKKELINKIFEPFFTTKPAGVGTGLGLSIIKNILDLHNAKITVKSQLNKGTVFIIRFNY